MRGAGSAMWKEKDRVIPVGASILAAMKAIAREERLAS